MGKDVLGGEDVKERFITPSAVCNTMHVTSYAVTIDCSRHNRRAFI